MRGVAVKPRVIPIRTVRDLMDHDDIVKLLGGLAVSNEVIVKQSAELLVRFDRMDRWQSGHDEFTRSQKETQDKLVKDVDFLMKAHAQATGTVRAVTWGVKIAWGVFGGAAAFMLTMLSQLILETIKRGGK